MPVESKSSSKQTILEEGTDFRGKLTSSCAVVINGNMDGELDAPEVSVAATGSVSGAIKAKKLVSRGTLAGSVEADEISISGNVKSNTMIIAKTLEVRLAPERGKLNVTFGECLLEIGDEPSKELALPEAAALAAPAPEAPEAAAAAAGEPAAATAAEQAPSALELPADPAALDAQASKNDAGAAAAPGKTHGGRGRGRGKDSVPPPPP